MISDVFIQYLNEPSTQVIITIFLLLLLFLIFSVLYSKLSPESKSAFNYSLMQFCLLTLKMFPLISRDISLSISNDGRVRLASESEKQTEKTVKNLEYYMEQEYNNSKNIRVVFTNLFVIFTFFIMGAFVWLDKLNLEIRITLGFIYLSFSFFVLFIIKSCYRRSSVILAVIEDLDKKELMQSFLTHHKKDVQLNEYDIEFLKIISLSRAEREKNTSHPYEILLKNVSGSSVNVGKGSVKIGDVTDK